MGPNKPNLIITGTPGVGKSSISTKVAKLLGYKHIDISKLAIEKQLILERDEERDCDIIDERRIRNKLKKKLLSGGCLVEYHSCGFLRKDWFDIVYVLRATTNELHARLTERGYPQEKISENIDCEIFQVPLEEAYETFGSERVVELQNNTKKELKKNIKTIVESMENMSKDDLHSNENLT